MTESQAPRNPFRLPEQPAPKRSDKSGFWFHWKRGIRVKVASYHDREFAAKLCQLISDYQLEHGRINDEIVADLEREAVAITLVVDWENVFGARGTRIRVGAGDAWDAFIEWPGFYDFVIEASKAIPPPQD